MKAMLIDITRCNGCFNCQIACKDEHVDNDWAPYAKPQPDMGHFWMRVNEVERGVVPKVKVSYIPKLCVQCESPPCEKVARNGAVYGRKDGIVIIDPEKSRGQREILESCPYGCVFWNEGLDIPQKCTFCAHLLDQGWKEPRCVEACCTGAMIFGEYDQLKDIINKRKGEILNPEFGSKPRVYYIGLPKRFIAGTVLCKKIGEPLENAKITLLNLSTQESITTKVDNYGDFEYEGLEIGGKFSILIEKAGYQNKLIEPVHTGKDIYLGEIFLLTKE
jgi:tetrathionate reductase subunit B